MDYYTENKVPGLALVVKDELIGEVYLELLMVTSFTYRAAARQNSDRAFLFETEEYRDPDQCWEDAVAEVEFEWNISKIADNIPLT